MKVYPMDADFIFNFTGNKIEHLNYTIKKYT